ncbi:MAG: hypothetical protein H5T69_20795, partial [Chloroflexi bacterium]|nr:hypothetical protein [Chloroflexota bacterium]
MDMLESIKMELDGNELLLEDFPEAVYPIHCLEGIANRCAGQLYKGQRTHIGWTAREIYWKSFVYARLATSMGDRGCLSLFGDRPEQHRLFAEHLTAEYRVRTEGRGCCS